MKALKLLDIQTGKIGIENVIVPNPSNTQVLIKIKAAALNKRDQWICEGLYPGLKEGTTLGSDGCGTVIKGPEEWIDKDVVVNPNINWGTSESSQSGKYSILGMPEDGTLAEYLLVDIDKIYNKPSHLTFNQAAALPLAGMTAYRACFTKGEIEKGMNVLIAGVGGGVANFAVKFAIAAGAHVFITSGSFDKIKRSTSQGVKDGFNYKDTEWVEQARHNVKSGFDVIIDGAGGDSLNKYLKIIKNGGRIIHYGATTGRPSNVDLFRLFWSQALIMGSTMASDKEFGKMIDFVEKHRIEPEIDSVFEFEDYTKAFERIRSSSHFGKVVITF